MPAPDFFFSLEFSSQGAPAALLEQLSSQLLTHVGVEAAELPELSAALQQAVAAGSAAIAHEQGRGAQAAGSVGQRRCDVQFRVRGSTLEIVVTANGGRIWQTSRAIR